MEHTPNNDDRVFIPYNENTKHIYEAYSQMVWNVANRQKTDAEVADTANPDGKSP